ncbi:hypothetical protein BKA62DRAFT_760675 [Auriculariales sp. MPI-PUGE-AT-0066]|nr:hypothetical protein BKA62DRAFT_760675 [Auriculariales sp. MPI-PUGE-AT-0066]
MGNTFSTVVDNTLSTAISSANVAGPATKAIPVVGNYIGHAIEAFGKLLETIEDAKSNNEDVAAFRVFLVAERAKVKNAVDDAPADRRPELDDHVLSRGKVEIDKFAALDPVRQLLYARAIKAKLAELKETLKRQVDSYVTSSVNLVLENQRRELQRVMLERLDPVISGTAQGSDAPSGCMKDTREELLRDIIEWANSPTGPCVFWLSGLAGTGKTAVTRSVTDRLAQAGIVVVSFFISRHSGRRSSIYDIVHTLAFELARVHETARAIIVTALECDARLHQLNIDEQVNRLLFEPLCAIFAASRKGPVVLVLDALDECNDPAALVGDGCLAKLIPALCGQSGTRKVKLFLTSRPLATIRKELGPFINRLGREVRLHEIPTTNDISCATFASSVNCQRLASATDLDSLVKRAGSLFIYAATVIRHIKEDEYTPHERLAQILSIQATSSEDGSPYEEVDNLYLGVLSLSVGPKQPKSLTDRVRQIIAAVVLARALMSTRMISDLLDIDHGTVWRIVSGLGAVWVTPVSESDPIVLYHKSFPDFILDVSRCTDQRFVVDCSVGHERLAIGCLHVLNTLLVRDICKIPILAGQELPRRESINDIEATLAHHVPPALYYSTVHLLHHLAEVAVRDISQALVNNLQVFCQEKLMFWLELTCLMGPTTLSNLIVQLTGIPAEILLQDHDRLSECGVLLRQLGQAAQYFEEPLRASHAEVYNSLLAFMPKNALKSAYSHIRGFINVVRADDWDYPANRALIRADGFEAENFVTNAGGSVVACEWFSYSEGQSILVWQNATRSSMHYTIPVQEETLVLLALHPSGRTLVVSTYSDSADLSQISVWQLSGAQPVLMRTRSVNGRPLALALDPTGRQVVLVSRHSVITLMIVDLANVISCCHEFSRTVQRAVFSSAGTALMAVSGTPRKYNDDDSPSTGTTIMVCRADCQWKAVNCGTFPDDLPVDFPGDFIKRHPPTLLVSCDGFTGAFVSHRKELVIYRVPSQSQHGIKSIRVPEVSRLAISSDGCFIVYEDRSEKGGKMARLQWQPTPQLQRIYCIEGSTSRATFIDHSACVLSKSDTIMLYSITTGKITFQQKLPGMARHVTLLSHGHAMYAHGGGFIDFIDTQAASNDSGPGNVVNVAAQSSCGMSVAVLETSESDGTVGTVWNISSGMSHTVAAPELTGKIIHFELTRGDLNLVAMDVNGLAVLPTNFTPNAERQYIQLEQNELRPSGLIFSHNQQRVAVDLYHSARQPRRLFIWDFPTFSNRRELDLGDANGPVAISRNGNLVAWARRDTVHVSLVDQADDHSHCQLRARNVETIVFCTSSPHLIVMDGLWLHDLWDLTNVRTPLLLRSFRIDLSIPLYPLKLILFNDGGHYMEIYLQQSPKSITRKIRGVSPWTTVALSDDQHNHSQTEPQVKAVCPARVSSLGDGWLDMELGTNRMLRASPPEQEGEIWSVVDAERPIGRRLCWLAELHRPKRPMRPDDFENIFWSGSHVFWLAESGAVTILDFSDHPLFQQPDESQSPSTPDS